MRAILTYHSVDDSGSVISVSPGDFAEQARWLASGAVKVMSVPDLAAYAGAEPAVALTFDDAFENFGTAAWPVLRDHGLPTTLFVPTRFVGKANAWDTMPGGRMPTLRLLDWDALGRLAGDGVHLGAHSRTHPDLRALDDARLADEIAGSFDDIARETGERPDGFAYPYGWFDSRVLSATRAACRWACTTVLASLGPADDLHRLPRLDAYFLHGPARLHRFGSRPFHAYLSLRAAIRRLRGR